MFIIKPKAQEKALLSHFKRQREAACTQRLQGSITLALQTRSGHGLLKIGAGDYYDDNDDDVDDYNDDDNGDYNNDGGGDDYPT